MGLKPEDKKTEAGVIPEEWEVSTVGREFSIRLGKMLDAEKNRGVPKPYIGNRAVQWGHIDVTDLPTVPMSRSDVERYRLLPGDLLVCEGGEVGRAAIWEGSIEECYYQKALHRLRPLRRFNSQLMVELLRQWSGNGFLTNFVTQTSIAHLTREKFGEVPLAVPSFPEQEAIAIVLHDVAALLDALTRLIAKKHDLKQAVMQRLLTGQTRLPGFGGEWIANPLGSVVTSLDAGVSVNSIEQGRAAAIDAFILKTSAVLDGRFDPLECKPIASRDRSRARVNPSANTILISRMNTPDLVGECAYVGESYPNLFLPDRLWMARLESENVVCARWLSYLLSSAAYKRLIKGVATGTSGSMKNISKTGLLFLPVLFPEANEQAAIAAVLSDMDAEISALEQRLAKTRDLKQGMMQELLTGRTRLV